MGDKDSTSSLIVFGTFIDAPSTTELRIRENHVCVVNHRGIIERLEEATLSEEELLSQLQRNLPADEVASREWQVVHLRDKGREVVFPGLIDCHVHAPQYAQLGNKTDLPLMKWLNEYTFPEEARYADAEYAREVYPSLVRRLIRNGTTTALYFGSSHLEATKILAQTCDSMGQRAFVGKNCSDGELCPEYYRETTEGSIRDTRAFVEWCEGEYGKDGRVRAVVTPRFTPTCTRTLLKELGSIAREHDAAIQTHAAETVDQVALVEELFPDEKRDVAVLRACGLLTARTILAHGCHLTTDEAQELVAAGAAVVSCPYSNMLFSRATLPVPHFSRLGLKVGLGTDIAGGWSSSVWENARLAVLQDRVDSFVRVGAHPVPADPVPPAWEVTFIYALHLATVGGARCLGLDTPAAGVGLLDVGRAFDALRIRLDAPDQRFDHRPSDPVADRFERFALTGDDRNIDAVWIAGRLVWERDAAGG